MATSFNFNNQQVDGIQKAPLWIKNGLDKEAILFAEYFGKELSPEGLGNKEALTTSQIRNVYGEVQRMKMKGFNKSELLLLKPRLAYLTERKGTIGSKDFRKVIEKALDEVLNGKDEKEMELRFQNFANFFEAILAYHRSFGGK
ncbi:type III-A CRISPR-associated protein Csm2 [Stygiobacter electus]|uniref:CRISPR system Cms protein Csm2 n=1 Tax=Stygiobacter electus TaxID=3032292 RepID=A0AAE3NY19_9BACT|nr:type III-A CRISPR-associated protein Csm2 [Stygiobacter electus]MDF1610554.1 type III-A CRISPR-associated protein Csm2 [Stygiobacter electus]